MKIFICYNISIERIAHKCCYATNGKMKVLIQVVSTPNFENQTYDLHIKGIPYIFENEDCEMKFKTWLTDQFIDHILKVDDEFINAHPVDAHV